jgi:hypothetical protein
MGASTLAEQLASYSRALVDWASNHPEMGRTYDEQVARAREVGLHRHVVAVVYLRVLSSLVRARPGAPRGSRTTAVQMVAAAELADQLARDWNSGRIPGNKSR